MAQSKIVLSREARLACVRPLGTRDHITYSKLQMDNRFEFDKVAFYEVIRLIYHFISALVSEFPLLCD